MRILVRHVLKQEIEWTYRVYFTKNVYFFSVVPEFWSWFLKNSWRFTVIQYTVQNVLFGNYETPKTLHHVDYFCNTNDILDCGTLWLGWYYFFNNTPCQFQLRSIIIIIIIIIINIQELLYLYDHLCIAPLVRVAYGLLCFACWGADSVAGLLPQGQPGCNWWFL